MNEYTKIIVIALIMGGLFFGGGVLGTIAPIWKTQEIKDLDESINQLGKSICEEEYSMDYESYIDNTLRCKPFAESYDGIKVEVPKDTRGELKW